MYQWRDRVDEANNPIARYLLVPRGDLEALDLTCCLNADDRAHLVALAGTDGDDILADTAYIPEHHWESHEVIDCSDAELADLLGDPGITAGPKNGAGGLPTYSAEEMDRARHRSAAAHVELRRRNYSEQDISDFGSGRKRPE